MARLVLPALVAAVAFLPLLRGALSGATLYFRDLGQYFLPLRLFALEGLRRGEMRLWNPLVHEGVPLSLPAVGYPLDLLALLRPDDAGVSLVLALHVPLAALAFLAMARGLSIPSAAAAGGALVYALGGFLLSTVNLYVYVQAAAWAPLLVLGLAREEPDRERRDLVLVAVALALGLASTGVELVAQALAVGLVLGRRRFRGPGAAARTLRLAGAGLLGLAMAAPVLVLVAGQVGGSARGRGLATDVVLAHSVHPFTLLQVVVGGLYGNLANLANEWWGHNFFPRGFPYVLSLYLGAAALAVAACGALSSRRGARTLALLAAVAVLLALGRYAGLAPLVEAAPLLRLFRFPVKAFFTAHLALSVLVSIGLAALLEDGGRRHWRRLAAWSGWAGAVLVAARALPAALPGPLAAFGTRFFPPGLGEDVRADLTARILADAATGGLAALALCALAALVLLGRLAPPRGAGLVAAVVAADLLRAGAGLNPMVASAFFRPSPELAAQLPRLAEGRVFTCSVEESPAYLAARAARGSDHELWSFATLVETLTPPSNLRLGVATALSPDVTMLVPEERALSPEEASCRDLDRILPRLREAAVVRVLSTTPLRHEDLVLEQTLRPARTAPLLVYIYALARPRPWLDVEDPATPAGAVARVVSAQRRAGRIEAVVESPRPAALLVREGWAPGWRAEVDGRPAAVARGPGGHLTVALPAGRSRVELRFAPALLTPALMASLVGLGGCGLLVRASGIARGALVLLAAVLASPAAAAPDASAARARDAARRVVDIPPVAYRPAAAAPARWLRRVLDLVEAAATGGRLTHGAAVRARFHPAVSVEPLPWRAAGPVALVTRTLGASRGESARAIVLREGEEWCLPGVVLPAGTRLRLESAAIGPRAAGLRVRFNAPGGVARDVTVPGVAPDAASVSSTDVDLPAGEGTLCLRAEGGPVAAAEARLVAPEAPEDVRPRWIVLTVLDATRADVLERDDAERIAPALLSLARRGHRYEEAVSSGAHTQAGVLPLLLGRDLARIDPLRAGRFTPEGTPLERIYSRANLAVSHLAQAAGYHSVLLGNNRFLRATALFARTSHYGRAETSTVDTAAALSGLIARHGDERLLLVLHLAAAHGYSFTPRRLYEALGCSRLDGVKAVRCAYLARVAHADEALGALLEGLRLAGLGGRTLHVVTADHGELLGDGRPIDVHLYDRWWGLDGGHGASTEWKELHVPLVMAGPGLAPATWRERVSTLDVVPTLAALASLPVPHRLDGARLPLVGGPRGPAPRLVSHGYCTHSVLEGRRQLVLWEAECARRREQGSGLPVTHRAELWEGGVLRATDATAPDRLAPLVRRHLEWLSERQPGEAWLVDTARVGPATLRVTVSDGRITDWGPSECAGPFPVVSSSLRADGRELSVVFDGRPGLFYVATWPRAAAARFEVDGRGVPGVTRRAYHAAPAAPTTSPGERALREWLLVR
jgi:hypothetical protein